MEGWKQDFVVHCPKKECKGMLLQNDECHEMKCSDCGKYFIERSELIEVNFNE